MTKCYQTAFHFSPVKRRQVEADFAGGDISSDAGVVLLSQVDRKLGLCRRGEFWGVLGTQYLIGSFGEIMNLLQSNGYNK